MSSFVLPFVFKDKLKKKQFETLIRANGIETRPLIGGNLLKQPFLKKYYVNDEYDVADMIHNNAFYIGNNQFVDESRLIKLEILMNQCLK